MKTGEKVRWVQHKPPGHALLLSPSFSSSSRDFISHPLLSLDSDSLLSVVQTGLAGLEKTNYKGANVKT